MQIEWSKTLVPTVTVLVLGALAWEGVLHVETLLGVVGGLLYPSPLFQRKPTEPTP